MTATGGSPTAELHVYLENGFEHDRVTLSLGDEEHVEPDVSTRYQVGLACVVGLALPGDAPVSVQVAVPARGLVATATLDAAATPYLRVDLAAGALQLRAEAQAPRLA